MELESEREAREAVTGERRVTRWRAKGGGRSAAGDRRGKRGKVDFSSWLEEAARLARQLSRDGPDYPQLATVEVGLDLEYVSQRYRAMDAVGVVETNDRSMINGTERKR